MFAWLMGGCRVLEAYTCDYRAGTNVVGKRAVSLDIEELMSVSVGEYGLPRLPARAHSHSYLQLYKLNKIHRSHYTISPFNPIPSTLFLDNDYPTPSYIAYHQSYQSGSPPKMH